MYSTNAATRDNRRRGRRLLCTSYRNYRTQTPTDSTQELCLWWERAPQSYRKLCLHSASPAPRVVSSCLLCPDYFF